MTALGVDEGGRVRDGINVIAKTFALVGVRFQRSPVALNSLDIAHGRVTPQLRAIRKGPY